jgi:hypothetical protein
MIDLKILVVKNYVTHKYSSCCKRIVADLKQKNGRNRGGKKKDDS